MKGAMQRRKEYLATDARLAAFAKVCRQIVTVSAGTGWQICICIMLSYRIGCKYLITLNYD